MDATSADVPSAADAAATDAESYDATSAVDSGVTPTPDLAPGDHVTFAEGRIALGQTFAQVKAVLGNPSSRVAGDTSRGYEWSLASNVRATIWLANSNLDNDDAPPHDVDNTDRVLWIAVSGSFTGHTPEGIGIGSTRAAAETAYGAAPHSAPIADPAGRLDTYYRRGLLIAYGQDDVSRTLTVCKTYGVEPGGTIDLTGGGLDFGASGSFTSSSLGGTSQADVRSVLGTPETTGPVSVGGAQQIDTWSFIGIEVFYKNNGAFFATVHPPYYGTPPGNGAPGFGSSRTDFEAYLSAQNFAPGVESQLQAGLWCYKHNNQAGRAIAATYAATAPNALTFLILGYPLVAGVCP